MRISCWKPVLFAALAGGMGWGIRGQYGHETGAMLAGLLVSLTLAYLLCPRTDWPSLFRAVAWGTVAMGIGGSMTYGHTLGLSHNAEFIGNAEAWRWGLLGCAVKGSLWIGFAGVFLGMGLGGVRYRPGEMLLLMLALVGAFYMGMAVLNEPFNAATGALPVIFFSDLWHWAPDAPFNPRYECWGGLLAALALLTVYVGVARQDRLAWRMALWGVLGGAIGFPLGQSLQSYHAWHREAFTTGLWAWLDPHMNWWNMMEMTFGHTMGAVLGFGLWLHRKRIRLAMIPEEDRLSLPTEMLVLAAHLALLLAVEFAALRAVDALYDWGIIMVALPVVGIAGGRWWPYLQMLPLTLLPIAGKTLDGLSYRSDAIPPAPGWVIYLIVPLAVALAYAVWLARRVRRGDIEADLLAPLTLFAAWLYFLVNFAFFRFPWPWADWTGRTPSGIIMTVCVIGLTIMVLARMRGKDEPARATAQQE